MYKAKNQQQQITTRLNKRGLFARSRCLLLWSIVEKEIFVSFEFFGLFFFNNFIVGSDRTQVDLINGFINQNSDGIHRSAKMKWIQPNQPNREWRNKQKLPKTMKKIIKCRLPRKTWREVTIHRPRNILFFLSRKKNHKKNVILTER